MNGDNLSKTDCKNYMVSNSVTSVLIDGSWTVACVVPIVTFYCSRLYTFFYTIHTTPYFKFSPIGTQ